MAVVIASLAIEHGGFETHHLYQLCFSSEKAEVRIMQLGFVVDKTRKQKVNGSVDHLMYSTFISAKG